MEQLEKQDKTVRKLKKQLKVFAKKIGELEGMYMLELGPELKAGKMCLFKDIFRYTGYCGRWVMY